MELETIRAVFGWCTLLNWGILLLWWLAYISARGVMYRIHGGMFNLTPEQFDAIHYKGMAYYKMSVALFNLTPYLALRIVA